MTASWLWLVPFAVVFFIGWAWTDHQDKRDADVLYWEMAKDWDGEGSG